MADGELLVDALSGHNKECGHVLYELQGLKKEFKADSCWEDMLFGGDGT